MKILLSGATGLIGKSLTDNLLKNNHSVNYLTTSFHKIENKPNFKGFYWNPKKNEIDNNAIENVDVIIHLAGANIAHRWTNSYKKEIMDSRVLSTNILYKTLKNQANQVRQFISASGTAIYPDSETYIYDENFVAKDEGFLNQVVQEWERSAHKINELNIKVCKLRTGIVYAKNGGALQEIIKPIKLGIGSSFGTGKQVQSWIHIEDLVNIYRFAAENQLSGVFNAVAPNPISDSVLTKTVAKILDKPLFMPNIPRFVMRLILGEMHELLFTDKNISAKKLQNAGFQFQFPEIEQALQNILK
jgi:uncharacterized protein